MRQWVKPVLALLWVAAIAPVIDHIEEINPERIESSALGFWAPVGFFAVYVVAMVLLGSAAVLNLAGGALFGPI